MERMGYELQVIPGCPNTAAALKLFQQALAAEDIAADLSVVELSTDEQAEALNFHGAPSFIASGRDLFTSTAAPALTCRVYQSPAGLVGLPTQEALQAALRSALMPM